MNERWLPVVGFDNYLISDLGNLVVIKTVDDKIIKKIIRAGSGGSKKYRLAVLFKDRKRHSRYISELVLTAFVSPRPTGFFATHIDKDVSNDKLENLKWSYRKNMGMSIPLVRAIREDLAIGISQTDLQHLYNISSTCTICYINNRVNFKHV